MRGARRPTAATVALLALGAAGCGGSSPGYAQQMHDALAPSGPRILKLRIELQRVRTTQEGERLLVRFRTTERAVRAKVAAITPPAKAAPAHRRLLAGFASLDRQISALRRSSAGGSLATFLQGAQRLDASPTFATIGGALSSIEQDGYPLKLG